MRAISFAAVFAILCACLNGIHAYREDVLSMTQNDLRKIIDLLAEDGNHASPTNDYKFGTLIENFYIRLHRYLFKKVCGAPCDDACGSQISFVPTTLTTLDRESFPCPSGAERFGTKKEANSILKTTGPMHLSSPVSLSTVFGKRKNTMCHATHGRWHYTGALLLWF